MKTIEIELTDTTATLPKELFLEILKDGAELQEECNTLKALLDHARETRIEKDVEISELRTEIEERVIGRQILVKTRDSLRAENERLKETCEKWAKDYHRSERVCSKLLSENQQIKSWKDGAAKILDDLQLQEIGQELGLTMGTDIAPEILPGIQRLKDRTATLECEGRDYRNLLRQINHLSQ